MDGTCNLKLNKENISPGLLIPFEIGGEFLLYTTLNKFHQKSLNLKRKRSCFDVLLHERRKRCDSRLTKEMCMSPNKRQTHCGKLQNVEMFDGSGAMQPVIAIKLFPLESQKNRPPPNKSYRIYVTACGSAKSDYTFDVRYIETWPDVLSFLNALSYGKPSVYATIALSHFARS